MPMLRASLCLGLLMSVASGAELSSCDGASGKCAEESATLLQFKSKATLMKNVEEDVLMEKDASDDALANHASMNDNIADGSSTNKTAMMEKFWGWHGCGTVNNGAHKLGIRWGASGKVDAKIEWINNRWWPPPPPKFAASIGDCRSCVNNLQRVQGYKCSDFNCINKFWGVYLVSSGCYKTPSPTPAPPTAAPTTPAPTTPAPTPAPTFSSQTLSGKVVNPKTGHAEAGVKVTASVGAVVKDGLSDAAGKWQISDVPVGNGTLSYTKKDFVTKTANISVSDHVPVQPLSASVSHVLPPKDWRILLEWAAQPKDLDSHTFMGGCSTVYYGAKSSSCSGTSVTLDLDDQDGNGPETTTLKNLPDCGNNCNVVFKVHLFANTGNWSNSDAKVTVIHGGGIAKEFAVASDGKTGDCKGDPWWAVFTLNGKTGALAPYAGDVCAEP